MLNLKGAECDAVIPVCDCRHEALLLLLRQDIWGALAMAACRPHLAALSHACQVCGLAWSATPSEMKEDLQQLQDRLAGQACESPYLVRPELKWPWADSTDYCRLHCHSTCTWAALPCCSSSPSFGSCCCLWQREKALTASDAKKPLLR